MKKVVITLFLLLIFLGVIVGGGYFYYLNNVKMPLKDNSKNIVIEVKENESLYELLERLEGEEVLKSANLSKLFYKLSKKDLEIQVGKHEVKMGSDLNEVLSSLKNENMDNRIISIPEGYTVEDIANVLEKGGMVKKADFLKAANEFETPSYIKNNKDRRYKVEGFLKADEYTFTKGMTSNEILKILNDKFTESFKAILAKENINLPEDKWDELITKASMIEKETWVPEEKAKVASVIENRLKDKMQLQIDATILYAVNDQKKEITMDDILDDNPYNTYSVKGLPAGPICNPGKLSIIGALKPEETDFIYYLVNPKTGKHYFTKDYDDFMAKREEFNSYTNPPEASNSNNTKATFKTAPSVILFNNNNSSNTEDANNTKPKKKTTEEKYIDGFYKSYMPYIQNEGQTLKERYNVDLKIKFPKITIPRFVE